MRSAEELRLIAARQSDRSETLLDDAGAGAESALAASFHAVGAAVYAVGAEIVERLDILIAQSGQSGPRSAEVHESPMDKLKRGESLRGEG